MIAAKIMDMQHFEHIHIYDTTTNLYNDKTWGYYIN